MTRDTTATAAAVTAAAPLRFAAWPHSGGVVLAGENAAPLYTVGSCTQAADAAGAAAIEAVDAWLQGP